jgi:hypothetical protein
MENFRAVKFESLYPHLPHGKAMTSPEKCMEKPTETDGLINTLIIPKDFFYPKDLCSRVSSPTIEL